MSQARAKSSGSSRPGSRGATSRQSGSTKPGSHQEKRQIVGQYMIGKTIGEGTFGKVKLAVHIPTGEKVAIKILEKSRIKEQADVRRVNREIKILKKARHGNIIQLYEVLDTQNTIYLIMECAEGGEMFDFIVAQKHVAEIQACKFFHQIIDGVELLHQNEITHRDLKPENLLLKASPDGWIVKIVDFGLSNTHEGGRLLVTACGSPCYAAPEMIAGKKYVGPLADLWSIGVILFALVCGYLPFEDPNTSQLYKKILSGDYKPPKWISSEVRDLIRCILEVDPRKRYTVADIRRHPWYNLVPESAIPKEQINVYENEQTRAETLAALTEAGLDPQAVMDGVESHACNSLTAMYYLLEQKHRALRARNPSMVHKVPVHPSHIPVNGNRDSNGANNGTTATVTAATVATVVTSTVENVENVRTDNGAAAVGATPAPSSVKPSPTNATAAQVSAAVPSPATNTPLSPTAAATAAAAGGGRASGAAKPTLLPPTQVAPYLQTPTIMQQYHNKTSSANSSGVNSSTAQQQQQTQPSSIPPIKNAAAGVSATPASGVSNNIAMPNLEYYMKNGMGGTGGTESVGESGKVGVTTVPKLKLPGASGGGVNANNSSAVAAVKGAYRPPGYMAPIAAGGPNAALMSQTARQAASNNNVADVMNGQPNSARAVLISDKTPTIITTINNQPVETDVPVKIPEDLLSMMPTGTAGEVDVVGERPNTRRSHSRQQSRGGETAGGGVVVDLREAMGSLNLEEADGPSPKFGGGGGKPVGGGAAVEGIAKPGSYFTGTVVPIVAANPIKPTAAGVAAAAPVVTVVPATSLKATMPDLPPRASSSNGGRRGKNLASANPGVGAPPTATAGTAVAVEPVGGGARAPIEPSAGSGKNNTMNPRAQALKNKLAQQGSSLV